MANQISEKTLQEIVDIVGKHPDGIAAPDVLKALPVTGARRTLQYRLKHLVSNHRLQMDKSGRWAKYHLAIENPQIQVAADLKEDDYDHLISLTNAGKRIRDYVRQAPAARKPVGYSRRFLEQYKPNTSFYLTREERARLGAMGSRAID